MRIASANIKNFPDMPRKFVAADAAEVSDGAGILAGQEIDPGEDDKVVLGALPEGWREFCKRKFNPIFLGPRWRGFDETTHHVNRKGFHQTPKNSHICSVAVQDKDDPTLPTFAVVSCHMIVGGYNGKRPLSIRRVQWHRELRWLRKVIRHHVRRGRSVFVCGDFNRRNCPPVYKGLRWLTHGGIDYIGFVPVKGSVTLSDVHEQKVKLHSDHDGRIIKATLHGGR